MSVSFARPDVSELTFQVFGRSVHPELTTVFARREFRHAAYTAELLICEAGHMVGFRSHDSTVTEIATTGDHPLPRRLRSFRQRLNGNRHRSVRFAHGVLYEVSFHVERLDPEVYLNFHHELLIDSGRVELAHSFPASTRFSPKPLSLIRADAQQDSLLVHTYHTFPENSAVVKSQSLFELG